MSPQCQTVLKHLQIRPARLTGVEAEQVYRVRHLPRRIKDLKEGGFVIHTERKQDLTGQRYVRYTLVKPA